MYKQFACVLILVSCGPATKPAPVTVTLTADVATLASPGNVALTATASMTVAQIEIYEGSALLQTIAAATASISVAIATPGTHAFTARAYNQGGVSSDSNTVIVTATFASDMQAPTMVTLEAPATTYAVGETVVLLASANDNVGVTRMEFYEGGTKLGEDAAAPFTIDVSLQSPGTRSFVAKAFDAANNSATSSPVSVTATPRMLWHASYRESKIRGFAENRWGVSPAATAANADVTVDVAACASAKPNALLQDGAGNLIFTDDGNNRVLMLDAAKVTTGGVLAAADCHVLQTGLASAIGVALDADKRSVFVGHSGGISYIKYAAGAYAAGTALVTGAAKTFSGLLLQGDRLYAANYANFVDANATVSVYAPNAARTSATLLLDVSGDSQDYAVPEGIAIAAERLWVASNGADNVLGIALSEIEAQIASHPGTHQIFAGWKLLYNVPPASALHCPGDLSTDYLGDLWVNVQGASDAAADCGSTATALGHLYKFSASQLVFAGASSSVAPSLQIEGVSSVPGFGGIWFGR